MSRPLVIHHAGCRDGYCAAWVCRNALLDKDPEFHEGYYGQPAPDCTGRDVIIVDFSYPLEEMNRIAEQASTVLVLDHHKSSQEALALFRAENAEVHFDMTRSGAKMAWDFYNSGKTAPWLVQYVQDRDLWRHKLKHTHNINAYISVLPFTFEAWDAAMKESEICAAVEGDELMTAINSGDAIRAKINQYVREVSKNKRLIKFDEHHNIPIVNAPQTDISELLDILRQDHLFAVGWWQRGDGTFQYSLRSKGDFDVSELAKRRGGGGHRNAAGFESMNMINFVPMPK